ncbi:hypothetical protein K432DRAFT_395320 [Lepidopterella palustris CBS 459.81]|uniref:Uncharacterized protein n=1 Tax=Lepidopterella palustris CBS 459.81 TaxID=1314670 RepID=A0A8E2JCS6_9PEZI|nr:hypothetical protein K432DRAFT_395320 [Lepidopterella palustris CBS 459.81]
MALDEGSGVTMMVLIMVVVLSATELEVDGEDRLEESKLVDDVDGEDESLELELESELELGLELELGVELELGLELELELESELELGVELGLELELESELELGVELGLELELELESELELGVELGLELELESELELGVELGLELELELELESELELGLELGLEEELELESELELGLELGLELELESELELGLDTVVVDVSGKAAIVWVIVAEYWTTVAVDDGTAGNVMVDVDVDEKAETGSSSDIISYPCGGRYYEDLWRYRGNAIYIGRLTELDRVVDPLDADKIIKQWNVQVNLQEVKLPAKPNQFEFAASKAKVGVAVVPEMEVIRSGEPKRQPDMVRELND